MKKWEYDTFSKNINLDDGADKNILVFLNDLGEEGWEVVRDNTKGSPENKHITISVLCKREKSMIVKP